MLYKCSLRIVLFYSLHEHLDAKTTKDNTTIHHKGRKRTHLIVRSFSCLNEFIKIKQTKERFLWPSNIVLN